MLAPESTRSLDDSAPVPLSFPALLRNPGLASRYAYLSDSASAKSKPTAPRKHKTLRRDDNEGKRWIRRKDNARFSGNIHIVQPGKRDYQQPVPHIRPTFPEPLPVYLARNNKVPGAVLPTTDPRDADCGRFSLSLKGMRRDLRKMSFRSKPLVVEIETELVTWLEAGGTQLTPDEPQNILNHSGTAVGSTGTVVEISRTPLQLVWRMADDSDAFARYVVPQGCELQQRNVWTTSHLSVATQRQLPEHHAAIGVETPPATDIDLSSQLDTDSEFASDHDTRSEAGELESIVDSVAIDHNLDTTSSAHLPSAPDFLDDDWSEVGDVEDGDETGDESMMAQSIDSLGDPDATFAVRRGLAQLSLRARTLDHASHDRSTSSPSRSPTRPTRQTIPFATSTRPLIPPKSFYEYLFS
ncbi:hypothetical protein B0H12DRAFT_1271105 [Mycena haematopus]|nr:hypothetical protein B0H12DRAFT_1271105 [Mycena haematopus]